QDALVIDNTGYLRDEIQLSRHFSSPGTLSVLLTAPGKGMPNIIMGVNDAELKSISEGSLISAASCTTNAIAPVLAVIQQHLRILKGHVETIHAYTNDQNLVDNMHRKARRGRAAALNMVITETGAGTAMAKVFPNLKGKLTSNAIRVPVPDGSLAILHLELADPIDRASLNNLFQQAAAEGNLSKQIYFSGAQELVSSDIIGTSAASIVDGLATQVSNDGRTAILYIWYDNEYGYSHQVIRLAEKMVSITHQA
ncbi:MAG: glyceraldehyde-3-phosphate dehydrogenase, partial [Sphingobacterium sp.]